MLSLSLSVFYRRLHLVDTLYNSLSLKPLYGKWKISLLCDCEYHQVLLLCFCDIGTIIQVPKRLSLVFEMYAASTTTV